jgi:hypothetical protein
MSQRQIHENDMPDVPDPDFVGTLVEIWLAIGYAAYHFAYIRVYLQTASLQTSVEQIRKEEQSFRDMSQVDLIVCRAHLAAFFWQVDHVFEALRIAINRGQKEHANLKYFWSWGKALEKIEALPIYKEINAYRNKSHEFPAVIGCKWEDKGNGPKFVHHFLPTIEGHEAKEDIDINEQLQKYFEFAANSWLSFSPDDFRDRFPRSFKFTVTVPHTFLGELPSDLAGVPQLEVSVVAEEAPAPAEEKGAGSE